MSAVNICTYIDKLDVDNPVTKSIFLEDAVFGTTNCKPYYLTYS